MDILFKAYASNSMKEAIKKYIEKMAETPTVAIIRPNMLIDNPNDERIIRTRFAAHGCIMLTHFIDLTTANNHFFSLENGQPAKSIDEEIDPGAWQKSEGKTLPGYIELKAGRPKKGGGICPHCKQGIIDFNSLGWWWGWIEGIEPPYWEELRLYVFRRDHFRCQNCKRIFPAKDLRAHHIIPKEQRGEDSARNLITFCDECHLDPKPIFSDENK